MRKSGVYIFQRQHTCRLILNIEQFHHSELLNVHFKGKSLCLELVESREKQAETHWVSEYPSQAWGFGSS